MSSAQTIREAVVAVERLRAESRAVPGFGVAVHHLKRLQARRFAGTYADLPATGGYNAVVRFFLDELYGEHDATERDAQFVRISGTVERLFPRDVAETAASLARLHALTESLDHETARAAMLAGPDDLANYVRAWRTVGRRQDREQQLAMVLALGAELARLTRLPGLRLMLRMMRGPALAAGLGPLQHFLESGFDTFAGIARVRGGAERLLATIREREQALLRVLFDAEVPVAEAELRRLLGQAR